MIGSRRHAISPLPSLRLSSPFAFPLPSPFLSLRLSSPFAFPLPSLSSPAALLSLPPPFLLFRRPSLPSPFSPVALPTLPSPFLLFRRPSYSPFAFLSRRPSYSPVALPLSRRPSSLLSPILSPAALPSSRRPSFSPAALPSLPSPFSPVAFLSRCPSYSPVALPTLPSPFILSLRLSLPSPFLLSRRPSSLPSPFLSPVAYSLSRRPSFLPSPFLSPVALSFSRLLSSLLSPVFSPVAPPLPSSSLPSPFISPTPSSTSASSRSPRNACPSPRRPVIVGPSRFSLAALLEARVVAATLALDDTASKLVYANKRHAEANGHPFGWEEFKAAMLAAFLSQPPALEVRSRLENIQCGDQPVREYAKEFEKTLSLLKTALPESEVIHQFFKGLPEHIKRVHVVRGEHQWRTYKECKEQVIDTDVNFRAYMTHARAQQQPSAEGPRGGGNRTQAHRGSGSWKRPYQQKGESSGTQSKRAHAGPAKDPQDEDKPPAGCRICGKLGHKSYHCRWRKSVKNSGKPNQGKKPDGSGPSGPKDFPKSN
ncbi:unnamed protein product [Closterium sp. Naga37s-1]|nr:unnamed protein product [Closterium sp. Naga37s-1]